jgi:hypothetical protein
MRRRGLNVSREGCHLSGQSRQLQMLGDSRLGSVEGGRRPSRSEVSHQGRSGHPVRDRDGEADTQTYRQFPRADAEPPVEEVSSNSQDLWIKDLFRQRRSAAPGHSTSLPLMKVAPARTRATRWSVLTARQRYCPDSISLDAIAGPVAGAGSRAANASQANL